MHLKLLLRIKSQLKTTDTCSVEAAASNFYFGPFVSKEKLTISQTLLHKSVAFIRQQHVIKSGLRYRAYGNMYFIENTSAFNENSINLKVKQSFARVMHFLKDLTRYFVSRIKVVPVLSILLCNVICILSNCRPFSCPPFPFSYRWSTWL